jgi:hypothetical protein
LEYIQWTILYDSFQEACLPWQNDQHCGRTLYIYCKIYELITYSNEYRPYLAWFLLSYITLDVLRFYLTNTINVILHSKVFVDKMNCNYVLAEIPFQPPPSLTQVWFMKSSILKGFAHNEYK